METKGIHKWMELTEKATKMVKKELKILNTMFLVRTFFGLENLMAQQNNTLEQWLDIESEEITWRVINCIYNTQKCVIINEETGYTST